MNYKQMFVQGIITTGVMLTVGVAASILTHMVLVKALQTIPEFTPWNLIPSTK